MMDSCGAAKISEETTMPVAQKRDSGFDEVESKTGEFSCEKDGHASERGDVILRPQTFVTTELDGLPPSTSCALPVVEGFPPFQADSFGSWSFILLESSMIM